MTHLEPARAPAPTIGQQAAVARLAYALETPAAGAVLCGPRGVGKSLVLGEIAANAARGGRRCQRCLARDGVPDAAADVGADDGILLVDDAHLVTAGELAAIVATWRQRMPAGGFVLAGEGRLLTLVARDERLERAVMLRAVLRAFTLDESRAVVASLVEMAGSPDERAAVGAVIHEIAAGIPAQVVRLAEFVRAVAASTPQGWLTPDHVEALHRRISLEAA